MDALGEYQPGFIENTMAQSIVACDHFRTIMKQLELLRLELSWRPKRAKFHPGLDARDSQLSNGAERLPKGGRRGAEPLGFVHHQYPPI